MGEPAYWGLDRTGESLQYPASAPSAQQIAGGYLLAPKSQNFITNLSHIQVQQSSLTLLPNHAAVLQNVYEYDEGFEAGQFSMLCRITGDGKWSVFPVRDVELSLHLETPASIAGPDECSSKTWLSFQVLGRSRPIARWSYIGDPDEGTGLRYVKR